MITDKDRTPVAQHLVTKCTKCKMELNHVVMSHTLEGTVARVKCRTCGSEHKYHPDKKKTPKKTTRAVRKTAVTSKVDFAIDYEKRAKKLQQKKPVPYSIAGSFAVNDVIDHKTFGTGFVVKVLHQRMEVAFPDGPRTLACNR